MKFEVGQRVKVVKSVVHGNEDYRIGDSGVIESIDTSGETRLPIQVRFFSDRMSLPFDPSELELIDAPKNVTAIEGEVNATNSRTLGMAFIDDTNLLAMLAALNGKRVKLTLEVCE
jgi:hypothetical protein